MSRSPSEKALDKLVSQMLASQGEGCDPSLFEIDLRERGPARMGSTPSLENTIQETNRASRDASESIRSELIDQQDAEVTPVVMDAGATPPGQIRTENVAQEIIENLDHDLAEMAAAYRADPENVRNEDSIAENAKVAAYFALRASQIAYSRFIVAASSAHHMAGGATAKVITNPLFQGVIIGVVANIVFHAIVGAGSG